jgi:hypothetical protein
MITMNINCYFCGDTGLLSSDEACDCLTGTCNCHNCLFRKAEKDRMINEHLHKWENEKRAKQKETVYTNKKLPYKQWEQPELPFNNHKKGPTGYDPSYPDKNYAKKKITKPDPATVEAELQLEEQLWQS